jgi:nicotinamidase/pyrazinamidase
MESAVTARVELSAGDALLVVDVQNDFLPGGSLAVLHGEEVVPVMQRYITAFHARGLPIFATRDWHPPDHCSFRDRGGTWPIHCVAGSFGAEPPADLVLPSSAIIIRKATTAAKDAYSGFEGTQLNARLRASGIHRLFIGGLATDYCVLNTVKDALVQGYAAFLLVDAIRAVNVNPDDGRKAEEAMIRLGAVPIRFLHLAA